MNTTRKNHHYLPWTPEECQYLISNYATAPRKQLQSHLQGRQWSTITVKANSLGLKRPRVPHSKLERLLAETPEAYYWMGFLCADGSFTEYSVAVGVAEKDLEHLKRLHVFLDAQNKIWSTKDAFHQTKYCSKPVITALMEKFGITTDKTHHPCEIKWITSPDLLFSFIIGFIDGDGSVHKVKHANGSYCLRVCGYPTWLPNFTIMQSFLYKAAGEEENVAKPQIRDVVTGLPQNPEKRRFKQGSFYIYRKDILHWMRRRADELRLPYMQRKLGQIPQKLTRYVGL